VSGVSVQVSVFGLANIAFALKIVILKRYQCQSKFQYDAFCPDTWNL